MYHPRRPKKPPRQDFDAWLLAYPAVAASIVWEDSRGPHAYPSWSAEWKAELRQAFALARIPASIPVAEVPANQRSFEDTMPVETVLASADAWAYYKASVARSLAAEIGRELHWSVTGYTAPQLAQIFDSREMFRWSATYRGYWIMGDFGIITPAPPLYSYEFLTNAGLIGDTRLSTLGRVIGWCRDNLVHYSGYPTAANMEDTWQYRGFPPMVRVLAGTRVISRPDWGVRCQTAGCFGTVGLLRALLRVVNIPVRLMVAARHTQPWFMADGRYLTHGDDPYDALAKATPPFPAEELLIDQATYDAWFGPAVSDTDQSNNIGRRLLELALVYLPDYLLRAYCHDIANRRGHGDGDVFAIFSRNYTVSELEREDLWARMDAKIAGFGGCGHIP